MSDHPHDECVECQRNREDYRILLQIADERAATNIALRTKYGRLRKASKDFYRVVGPGKKPVTRVVFMVARECLRIILSEECP